MEEVLKNFPQPSLDGGKLLQWSSFVVDEYIGYVRRFQFN
jgi:hypothetical protein